MFAIAAFKGADVTIRSSRAASAFPKSNICYDLTFEGVDLQRRDAASQPPTSTELARPKVLPHTSWCVQPILLNRVESMRISFYFISFRWILKKDFFCNVLLIYYYWHIILVLLRTYNLLSFESMTFSWHFFNSG